MYGYQHACKTLWRDPHPHVGLLGFQESHIGTQVSQGSHVGITGPS